ncbi:MAG: helicase RepA family protein [Oscillospiraceae bacterium]|nr:helicase RepA family protein [Oscillospiraceae bacterium]
MYETKPSTQLDTINAKTLLDMDVPPTHYIISDLLPVGLHLLAGSPKIGKSWLALWLCNQIAAGENVWQSETKQCPTLYLSLEDTMDRLHLRLSSITEDGSSDSWFATNADTGSLVEQLEAFIAAHPEVGLIVIDTLAHVRDNATSSYMSDYEEMRRFKDLADKHRLALVLVHHLRKDSDSDPVNMVSGTSGLVGAVDGIYILQKARRANNEAVLHITGRDVSDTQLCLEFDREDCVWKFIGFESGAVEPLDERLLAAIEQILMGDSFTGTATELIAAMQAVDDSIEIQPNRLTRLLRDKVLTLQKRGISFSDKRTNSARLLTLARTEISDGDDSTPGGKAIVTVTTEPPSAA